ncbi:type II toxin-antitoxin system VapC family toxin [Candidatus Roizmanbacteria bacterium]|nr:type II toxin-antitoxin system VapC family toxin [Candidatus Roizmanbacteria bacterium]
MGKKKILIDTSVLIDIQRGTKRTVETFDTLKENAVISRITACEFMYGSRNTEEKDINKDFLEQLPIVEITPHVSKLAYRLLDKYALKFNVGMADALIAASAIYNDLKLWTLNRKHFEKIKEADLF